MVVFNLAIFTTFDNDSYSVQRRYTRINLRLKPSSYAQFDAGANLLPVQIYTRVQICTPLRPVHMQINCVHMHLDFI